MPLKPPPIIDGFDVPVPPQMGIQRCCQPNQKNPWKQKVDSQIVCEPWKKWLFGGIHVASPCPVFGVGPRVCDYSGYFAFSKKVEWAPLVEGKAT
jgi:hypothetical protein